MTTVVRQPTALELDIAHLINWLKQVSDNTEAYSEEKRSLAWLVADDLVGILQKHV